MSRLHCFEIAATIDPEAARRIACMLATAAVMALPPMAANDQRAAFRATAMVAMAPAATVSTSRAPALT